LKRLHMMLFTALILILMLCLSGCVIITSIRYPFWSIESPIERIVIYDLESSIDRMDASIPYVCEVPAARHDALIEALKEPVYSSGVVFPAANDPFFGVAGTVIGIFHTDGSVQYITNSGFSEYVQPDGRTQRNDHHCPSDQWDAIIATYLEQN